MNGTTRNLGQIAAIWISPTAPENNKLIWYDTSSNIHKVCENGEWNALNPQIVTNSTISALKNIARSGLSVGKFYYLTDVGTLAIVITTTKIWYVDSHNNYVVNDLAATIVSYLNSSNLLIDGSTGVWNNATGRLEFNFIEVATGTSLQNDNDYIVIRRKNGTAWSWVKAKISGFISAVSGNSISWNNGFYFNFATAINNIKNKVGGVLGYDKYNSDKEEIIRSITNIASYNQQILSSANNYTDGETAASKIYGKMHFGAWNLVNNPPNKPNPNDTLETILQILVSWVNELKNSNKILIGSGFLSNGRAGNISYADSVKTAIEKLVYKLKNLSTAAGINLPDDFNFDGDSDDFSPDDTLDVLLEKMIYLIKNLADAENVYLPNDWSEATYSGDVVDNDSISVAIGKLFHLFNSINSKVWNSEFQDDWTGLAGNVGDEIGEFDSNGKALYSATLEGAMYLLAKWYSKHFHRYYNYIEPLLSLNGFYYEFNGSMTPSTRQFTISYKLTENNLVLKSDYKFLYETLYDGSKYEDNNFSYDLPSSFILKLPQNIIDTLIKKFGVYNPFNLGIPINIADGLNFVEKSEISNVSSGTIYGVVEQSQQGETVDSWLKLIPFLNNAVIRRGLDILQPISITNNSFIRDDGTHTTNQYYQERRYSVVGGNNYAFSGSLSSGSTVIFVAWLDSNGDFISSAGYKGSMDEDVTYTDEIVQAPANAAYAILNVAKSLAYSYSFKIAEGSVNDISGVVINSQSSFGTRWLYDVESFSKDSTTCVICIPKFCIQISLY